MMCGYAHITSSGPTTDKSLVLKSRKGRGAQHIIHQASNSVHAGPQGFLSYQKIKTGVSSSDP